MNELRYHGGNVWSFGRYWTGYGYSADEAIANHKKALDNQIVEVMPDGIREIFRLSCKERRKIALGKTAAV